MRLFLDAHESGRRLGEALRAAGHDVVAANEHPSLDGADDEELMDLAAGDGRIMVTHNARHFVPILIEWAASGHFHAGCVLVKGIDHSQIGALLRGLELLFEAHPAQEEWTDLTLWLTPG